MTKVKKIEQCRSCHADIVWLKTEKGKWNPVDANTCVASDEILDVKKHTSHFATCPNAKQHRKK